MRREIAVWKVLAAVLAVLAMSTGGAVALAQSQGDGEPSSQIPPDSRGALQPTRSTTYVPIVPCRIYSTTGSLAPFGVEEVRFIKVLGDLASEGGKPGGCDIPDAATAIEASISATFNQGPGYIRAWPLGNSEPQATFLNYTAAGATTTTGALDILADSPYGFAVKNYRSVTDVVIDVQGYYLRPLFAQVNPNGTVAGSSRVEGVTREGTGLYTVDFEVDTDTCARTVTVGRTLLGHPTAAGFATAHTASLPANAIVVQTYDTNGDLADRAFLVEVTC